MLNSLARAAQALATLRYLESQSAEKLKLPLPAYKAHVAQALQQFEQAAYAVAFDLVPLLFRHDLSSVVTKKEVRYLADTGDGGFVVQVMDLDPMNPGVRLIPGQVSTENWLQLMIDLPELLEILEVK